MKKIFLFCIMFLMLTSQVETEAKAIPKGYGAKISKYEIQSTDAALKKYGQKEVYRINPESTPIRGYSWYYNDYTKHYYLIRSYLQYFEETGAEH